MPMLDRRAFVEHLLSAAAALPLTRHLNLESAGQSAAAVPTPLRLEYARAAQKWVEALPIGGGRLGAMVFGGIGTERLQLNDDTLWSGGPSDTGNPTAREVLPRVRRAITEGRFVEADTLAKGLQGPYTQTYLPMGDLVLSFEHGDIGADYRRMLDLRNAVATTRFRVNTVHYTRETIASFPARVLVMRLTTDRPGTLRFAARLRSQLRYDTMVDGGTLVLRGRAPAHVDPSYFAQDDPVRYTSDGGMRFEIRVGAVAEGGAVDASHDALTIENADAVTLVLASATSFNGYDTSPIADGRDPSALSSADLRAALGRSWSALLEEHVADYRALFDRVAFSVDTGATTQPAAPFVSTDQQIMKLGAADPCSRLLFQYGRYLLIASSRPGSQPANLQGIWNDELRAAVELELHDQHQHRDELLAGRSGQPARAHRAAPVLHPAARRQRTQDGRDVLRSLRLDRAPQQRSLAAQRAGRPLRSGRSGVGLLADGRRVAVAAPLRALPVRR